jgi:oxygen-dependent protoporphyrinogen oxidase
MIAVVGAGISGLAVGHSLLRAGAEFVILEAAPRPGGVIRSVRRDGRVLDLGPQRLRLTAPLQAVIHGDPPGSDLLIAPPLPLYVHVDGRLRRVPLDLPTALTTDLFSWPDRARALVEPFTAGLRPDESAAAFFIRKFGRRNYTRVLAPLYGDLYGSDPVDMPARHSLARVLATLGVDGSLLRAMIRGSRAVSRTPVCSFRSGLQQVTDALAEALGDRVRLGTPVESIRREREGLRVTGDGIDERVDQVVLTCPAGAAGRALRELDPAVAAAFEALRYNPLALVHLESDADLRAMGYHLPLDAGRATRGVTSQHGLFRRDGLYTAFLGGATRPDIRELPDDDVAALAAAEFEAVTDSAARPIHVHRTRMPAWDRSWDGLDGLRLPDGISVCANWWGRPGVTGRLVAAARLGRRLAGAPVPR